MNQYKSTYVIKLCLKYNIKSELYKADEIINLLKIYELESINNLWRLYKEPYKEPYKDKTFKLKNKKLLRLTVYLF